MQMQDWIKENKKAIEAIRKKWKSIEKTRGEKRTFVKIWLKKGVIYDDVPSKDRDILLEGTKEIFKADIGKYMWEEQANREFKITTKGMCKEKFYKTVSPKGIVYLPFKYVGENAIVIVFANKKSEGVWTYEIMGEEGFAKEIIIRKVLKRKQEGLLVISKHKNCKIMVVIPERERIKCIN